MNILYLTYDELGSNAFASQLMEPARRLQQEGHRVSLCVCLSFRQWFTPGQQVESQWIECQALFDTTHRIPHAPGYGEHRPTAFLLARLIDRTRPDLIHARGPMATQLALQARTAFPRVRVVYDARGAYADEFDMTGGYQSPPLTGKALAALVDQCRTHERTAAEGADGVLAVTEALAAHCRSNTGSKRPHLILPCCTDGTRFAFDMKARSRLRKELGLNDNDSFLWLYAGSAAAWQEPEAVCRTVHALLQKHRDHHALILTRDDQVFHNALDALHADQTRIHLRSAPAEAMPSYLSASDAALLLRRDHIVNRVASPIKCGEYLCSGLPVLITKGVGDYSDLIAENGWGAVAPSLEGVAEAASLINRIPDGERTARGREAATLISWETHLPRLVQFYEDIQDTASPTLVHINHAFPVTTQTFTYREVEALREIGVRVRVVSAKGPEGVLAEEAKIHVEGTAYLPPVCSPATITANLRRFLGNPLRWLGWLGRCLTAPYPRTHGPRQVLQSLFQFLRAAPLADTLSRSGYTPHLHAQFADGAATTAMIAADWLGASFSFTSHTSYNTQLLADKIQRVAIVFSISEYDRSLLVQACAEAEGKTEIVHCGIPLEDWPLREITAPGREILSVGSLIGKKGHDVLIQACALLRERGIDFTCRIIGGGPLQDDLQRKIERLGLAETVVLAGAQPQEVVRPALYEAAVFCLACMEDENGDTDGIPVSLMEAMAAGVPVVSTRIAGIPELIEDGVSGRLAEPGNAESLAEALQAALDEADANARMTAAARKTIEEEFSLEQQGRRMAEALRRNIRGM